MDPTSCARDLCVVCDSSTFGVIASWNHGASAGQLTCGTSKWSSEQLVFQTKIFTPYVRELDDFDNDEWPIDAHRVTVCRSVALRAAYQGLQSPSDKFPYPREIFFPHFQWAPETHSCQQ